MSESVSAGTSGPVTATPAKGRLHSIDILRGIVMVIMALDHIRDFFSTHPFPPTDIEATTPGYFFTRWITHFCAPVFLLLAGTSAFLYEQKRESRAQLAKFLISRGLWLIAVEIVFVNFLWYWWQFLFLQVIWAIGWSMIALAGMIYLPRMVLLAVSIGIIALSDLVVPIDADQFGALGDLWTILFGPGRVSLFGAEFAIVYPLFSWFGVIGLGYAMGPVFQRAEKDRHSILIRTGIVMTILFLVLRGINVYGDPAPWAVQDSFIMTILSFLNTTKYPASLQFLLMTLGPSLILLPYLERLTGKVEEFFLIFGRVPFFYYLMHLLVGHALLIVTGLIMGYSVEEAFGPFFMFQEGVGFGLPGVYLAWIVTVAILYPVCRWYAGLKKRSDNPFLSYL